ncbi:TetR/AcrR family transcriptional regulator [Bosea sp. (in: a-proteobacteria)]|jgi:AcrR family transcriptional regulator|uniref:TetR/AcrR family transcriptional regulator n=1 Tax=Bosea sp. (in: a-proteobacteria) TaxID=1871050 RepID=UPI003F6FEF6B
MPVPRRRKQAERSAETRDALIQAATALLQSAGYANTTTALIAQHAGVTTGALHHHFPTKEELMFGVLDRSSERVLQRLDAQDHGGQGLGSNDNGIDVASLVHHLWELYGDPEYWAVWEIIIGTRADEALHPRIVAHRLDTMKRVVHPWVARHLTGAAPLPEMLALFEFILVAIRGLSLERFLDKPSAYFEDSLKLLAEMAAWKLAAIEAGAQPDA